MYWLRSCPRCKGGLFREDDLYGSYVNCLQCGHHLSEAEEESLCYQTPGAGNVDWRMAVELEVIDDVLGIDAEALTTEG
jgi:hypothetical protein